RVSLSSCGWSAGGGQHSEDGQVLQWFVDAAGAEGAERCSDVVGVGVVECVGGACQGRAVPVGEHACGFLDVGAVQECGGGQEYVEEAVLFEAFGCGVAYGVVQPGRALVGEFGGDGG